MTDGNLSYCKICEIEDFDNPDIRGLIREMLSSKVDEFGEEFPRGREERKHWEVAMTARALRDQGALGPDAKILGVGAGHEATIYWLTRNAGKVVATDLYEVDDNWSDTDSGSDMLTDPGKHAPGPWEPERLEVRHMNALELEFEDESFDGVFSSSSIEHFGEFEDVRRSVEEIYRVLKPGGVAAIATEFRLEGPSPGIPGTMFFDEPELRSLLLDGIWWDLPEPLDTSVSEATIQGTANWSEALDDIAAGRNGFSHYPHLILDHDPFKWTSIHVTLIKTRAPAAEWRRRSPDLPPKRSATDKLKGRLGGLRIRLGALLRRG